jgi:hypothetical protein
VGRASYDLPAPSQSSASGQTSMAMSLSIRVLIESPAEVALKRPTLPSSRLRGGLNVRSRLSRKANVRQGRNAPLAVPLPHCYPMNAEANVQRGPPAEPDKIG